MAINAGDSYTGLRASLLGRTEISGPARSKALSRLTDGWLQELAVNAGVTVGGVELVAVGGYGRGELSPYSDVDLLLLHSSETPPAYAGMVAEKLWYPIWDSPVRLDHAVRSVGGARQLARQDLADLLGVLDLRHLAGDAELGNALRAGTLADWRADARSRLPDLLAMCRKRWESSGDLAFTATGDLKNSRGGLRDMVVMRAVAASWVADCPHAGLEEARADLLQIRDALHSVAGRATDRLQLQDHDAVAERLGLADRDELLRRVAGIGRSVGHAVDLTWHRVKRALDGRGAATTTASAAGTGTSVNARTSGTGTSGTRTAGSRTGRPERLPLADGVVEQDGEAVLARAADPTRDPVLPLRLAAAAAQAGLPVAPATLARLARISPPLPNPWPAPALDELVKLLGAGHGLISVWESLDQAGLVARLLPGWERLRSMPQRDPVHRFTVDRHLVQTAVEAGRLVRTVARPDLLLISALLHDIGKGTGRDHSIAGAEFAVDLCRTLGLADAEAGVVVTLVRHHLLLVETAVGRDPDDPATTSLIAAAVGDASVLDLLEALTEADAVATGPGAWSSWRARQVAVLAAKVRAVMNGWQPPEYAPLDVDQQTVLDQAGRTGRPQVVVEPGVEHARLLVAAPDRVGLLADVAAALLDQRLTVQAAVVRSGWSPGADRESSTDSGDVVGAACTASPGESAHHPDEDTQRCRPWSRLALQTWQVTPEFGVPPDPRTLQAAILTAVGGIDRSPANDSEADRFATDRNSGARSRTARGGVDRGGVDQGGVDRGGVDRGADARSAGIRRAGIRRAGIRRAGARREGVRRGNGRDPAEFPAPSVRVFDGAAEHATVLEIRAHDATGLLHRAAAAIEHAGASVFGATAHTWGAEAVDVLYLQDLDGAILSPENAADLADRVAAALAAAQPGPEAG